MINDITKEEYDLAISMLNKKWRNCNRTEKKQLSALVTRAFILTGKEKLVRVFTRIRYRSGHTK